jgi:hypothetical protein
MRSVYIVILLIVVAIEALWCSALLFGLCGCYPSDKTGDVPCQRSNYEHPRSSWANLLLAVVVLTKGIAGTAENVWRIRINFIGRLHATRRELGLRKVRPGSICSTILTARIDCFPLGPTYGATIGKSVPPPREMNCRRQ